MTFTHQAIMEEYEITPYTQMILPFEYESTTYSRIIELEEEVIAPCKPTEIITKSCDYYGASYDGRRSGTKQIIGITHKAPVAIDPSNSIFFFPTTSPVHSHCIWLSHDHVLSFTRTGQNQTKILLRNKQSFTIDMSPHSFENQLHRTAFLKTRLVQRIEENKRKAFYLSNQTQWSQALEMMSDYTPLRKNGGDEPFLL